MYIEKQTIWKMKKNHLQKQARSVFAAGGEIGAGIIELSDHRHERGQLIYMAKGMLTCKVARGLWVLAPGSALWIPAETVHSINGAGPIETYCLYIDGSFALGLPNTCCTMSVSPLLRELILQCARLSSTPTLTDADSRLCTVLLDEIAKAPLEKLHLPMPPNEKIKFIADSMIANPADNAGVDDWASRLGISGRTLARLMREQTGMTFGRWRQQLHISLALQWLIEGVSVQKIAVDLGYESASSFVFMFRKTLGSPPVKYLNNRITQVS
jgi:AraC-like DNA-binding protein